MIKTWETTRTAYKVSDFVSWQRAGSLELSPSFQRRPVWQPGAKSYLLDTVVRGLPMPLIFLRNRPTDLSRLESLREVVDGQQRIRTLLSYIDPSLLRDFDPKRDDFTVQKSHNKEMAGKRFRELPAEIRRRILDYEFSVYVLPSGVDDREVLEVFARLNATGVKLNNQELRHAQFFGEMKTSMYDVASEQLQRWREWGIFDEYSIARMQEVELTSEFALLMLKGLTGKSQTAIDNLYKKKDQVYPERRQVESRFREIMDTLDDNLGSELPLMPFSKKTMFYHLFAFIYDIRYGLASSLDTVRPRTVESEVFARLKLAGQNIEKLEAPVNVIQSVARRTTHLESRTTMLKYLREFASHE